MLKMPFIKEKVIADADVILYVLKIVIFILCLI